MGKIQKIIFRSLLIIDFMLAFFLIFMMNVVYAADYYVSTTGNDGNIGLSGSPWKTIQHAANAALTGGDTVHVAAGTYNERVHITKSGSAGNILTFQGDPGAIVDGTGINFGWGGLIDLNGAGYIRIKGFKVQYSKYAGIYAWASGKTDIFIENNHTYDTYTSGIWFQGGNRVFIDGNEVEKANNEGKSEEISVSYNITNFEIKNNIIHDSGVSTQYGGEGIDTKQGAHYGKVYNNTLYNLRRAYVPNVGIYIAAWQENATDPPSISDVDNIEVFGNKIYGIQGWGMQINAEKNGAVHHIKIYDNIIYNNTQDCIYLSDYGIPHGSIYDISIVNNTVYGCQGPNGGIRIQDSAATSITLRNNIASQNSNNQISVANASNVTGDHNLSFGSGASFGSSVTADPQFITTGSDFHLQNTSPAKGAGLSSALLSTADYDGMSWNNPPSIGAYENGGAVPSGTSTPLPSGTSSPLPTASSSATPLPTISTPLPTGVPIPSMSAAPSAYVAPWEYGTFTDPISFGSFPDLIDGVTGWILGIVASVILLMMIIGGLIYITSAGDEQRMAWAKRIIIAALIGFLVIALSATLVGELKKVL